MPSKCCKGSRQEQKIIIPKGIVDAHETVLIELPDSVKSKSTIIVTKDYIVRAPDAYQFTGLPTFQQYPPITLQYPQTHQPAPGFLGPAQQPENVPIRNIESYSDFMPDSHSSFIELEIPIETAQDRRRQQVPQTPYVPRPSQTPQPPRARSRQIPQVSQPTQTDRGQQEVNTSDHLYTSAINSPPRQQPRPSAPPLSPELNNPQRWQPRPSAPPLSPELNNPQRWQPRPSAPPLSPELNKPQRQQPRPSAPPLSPELKNPQPGWNLCSRECERQVPTSTQTPAPYIQLHRNPVSKELYKTEQSEIDALQRNLEEYQRCRRKLMNTTSYLARSGMDLQRLSSTSTKSSVGSVGIGCDGGCPPPSRSSAPTTSRNRPRPN